jgi:hypothetical protein
MVSRICDGACLALQCILYLPEEVVEPFLFLADNGLIIQLLREEFQRFDLLDTHKSGFSLGS